MRRTVISAALGCTAILGAVLAFSMGLHMGSPEQETAVEPALLTAGPRQLTVHVPEKKERPVPSFSFPTIYSPAAILVREEDGAVLAHKNADQAVYPASLTKVMTCILAIEKLGDLDQTVTLPESMFYRLYDENASMAGFQPNETVKAIDLLYGVLLPSGAECCIGLAEKIAGSESAFADMMNQKAAELGMDKTHFVNTTGLHDEKHVSSVRDLAVLLQYAMQNETFREIFTSSQYLSGTTDQHPEGLMIWSNVFGYVGYPAEVTGGELLGGKTGYTSEAGLCLASAAKVQGEDYLLVTVGAQGSTWPYPPHILDALTVYNALGKELGKS